MIMRLNGVKLQGANVETVIIPRGDDLPIVLKIQAILDLGEFEKLCPLPKPPMKMVKGGQKVMNTEDSGYQVEIKNFGLKKLAYMLIKGLEATPDLVWDTVKLLDQNTWLNYTKELQEAGFSDQEMQRIIQGVWNANCLSEEKIQEARERFTRSLEVQAEMQLSPADEQSNTQSGVPANGSV